MTKEQVEKKIKELEAARQQAINDFETAKGNIRYFEGTIDALRLSLAEVPEPVDPDVTEEDKAEASAEAAQ